jgi:stage III sporulation protein AG
MKMQKVMEAFKKRVGILALVVVLFGALLLLLPPGGGEEAAEAAPETRGEDFTLTGTEARIASALSQIEGAGRVEVVLTLKTGGQSVIAQDRRQTDSERSESAVVVRTGTGEAPVELVRVYPEYLGALVVAEGAGSADVRLELIRAVTSLTGLGADKITVTKMGGKK